LDRLTDAWWSNKVKNKTVRRNRREHLVRSALLSGTAYALISCASAHAQTVINVSDGASLSAAIAQVDSNAATSYVINIQNNITLSGAAADTLNAFNTTSNVTVNGGGFTLDGGGVQRGFFVYAGNVAINNLTIQNTQALGGNGAPTGSSAGGGGGGLGAGGALFVASGGNVTVSNVVLAGNNATGGAGGAGGDGAGNSGGSGGGGGGLGGHAAESSGGGAGRGADGDGGGTGAGAGIIVGAASGGQGHIPGPGPVPGGINGGGGGNGAAGGVGGSPIFSNGQGGFGGGGSHNAADDRGGAGGFGGGGGGGHSIAGYQGGAGGLGGGGGGGAGAGQLSDTGGTGGSEGFGGGVAGSGGSIVANVGTSGGGGGGGGGGGLGGALFVQEGGSLTIAGAFNVNGSSVAGGAGAAGGTGDGGAGNGTAGSGGSAFGTGIFLQGNGIINFQPGSGLTQTVSDGIADQTGSGGTGINAGIWGLNKNGAGMLVLSAANTFSGNININAGTLSVAGAANLGNGNTVVIADGATFAVTSNATFASNRRFLVSGSSPTFDIAAGTTSRIQGEIAQGSLVLGGLVKSGTGTLELSGTNTYTGATYVTAGTLRAGSNNAFGSVNLLHVNGGATLDLNGFDRTFLGLAGAGTVTGANTTISGSFLPGDGIMPGTSMTVAGNLAFQSAAQYVVSVNPATSSFAQVTGTATLGGATVNALFAAGTYVDKRYTILTATGGVSGTFSSVIGVNTPSNFSSTLSYDANHVYLNMILNFAIPGGLNANQQAVGNALTNFFDRTGGIPAVFASMSANGLSQAAGETATGSQQTTFNAMNLFMGVMTDPFIGGRDEAANASGAASGYANEEALAYAAKKRNPKDALAAIYAKAPPMVPFQQRWSVWAAGYGGSQTTDGNTVVGSNNTTSRIYGTAVGADYRFSPFTIAGFSLAGGGTNFSVANGGTGRSDLFQAGAFIRHNIGAAYLSGALAYGWQDITTDRTVTIAGIDRLRAQFKANAWSGRVEGGYRFVAPVIGGIGFTPYAAGQFTTFELPAYAESVVSGANTFALAYGAKSVTATRSELGLRTDKSFAMQTAILTLRGRLAWAHDFNPDRGIGATFQTLPGASFFVNGAAQAADSALVTASAETRWMNGWSTAATFEGEFSNVTRSYAGKGVVRYAW
jgi:autotransporter-associated beta strand protein